MKIPSIAEISALSAGKKIGRRHPEMLDRNDAAWDAEPGALHEFG